MCMIDPQGHLNVKPTKPGVTQASLRTLTAQLETDMQAFEADLAEESRDDKLLSAMLASQKRQRYSTLFEYDVIWQSIQYANPVEMQTVIQSII